MFSLFIHWGTREQVSVHAGGRQSHTHDSCPSQVTTAESHLKVVQRGEIGHLWQGQNGLHGEGSGWGGAPHSESDEGRTWRCVKAWDVRGAAGRMLEC